MKPSNELVLNNVSANQNQTSVAITTTFGVYASVQAVTGSGVVGTVKLQGSNDYSLVSGFTPTNWNDITGASVNVTASSSFLIPKTDLCYEYVRAVFTPTNAGVQTIQPVADVSGSLNNTYFLLNSGNNQHLYYVWINVNSAGVDPMVPGRTGVEIDVATNASAATIGTALASAIAALSSTNDFSTSGTTTVTVTNKVSGPFVPMSDFNTGFTFAVTTPSGTISARLKTIGI